MGIPTGVFVGTPKGGKRHVPVDVEAARNRVEGEAEIVLSHGSAVDGVELGRRQ